MCGIAGKVFRDPSMQVNPDLLEAMGRAMYHRGPDDGGTYRSGSAGLCMRRLRIIDLENGGQPMGNEDGSLQLVFNGEIYNYRQLQQDLLRRGHQLRTDSDTEVVVHLYEDYGVECLKELRGMFALALWDSAEQSMFIARDRIGKKPIYYAQSDSALTFASELAPLLTDGDIKRDLDPVAVDEYLTCLFVPHPRTIYRDVRKLPPASYIIYRNGQLRVERWWDVRYRATSSPAGSSDQVALLEEILREAVQLRLVGDVPIGAFLSGGLDSSLVTAMMQQQASSRVKTFSIGFAESSFNEIPAARQVARALGTEHEEFVVNWDVRELLPKMLDHFGEPFADSSAIPFYHLSRMTRQRVTVALTGDGGDEVFGGYRRYRAGLAAAPYNRWPGGLGRHAFEVMVGRLIEPTTYYGMSNVKKIKRFVEFARCLREQPENSWAFFFSKPERAALYTAEFADILAQEGHLSSLATYFARGRRSGDQNMLWLDLMTYLPDDILVKADRMSMACSLEVRSPLLDQRIVEFMARVPRQQKYGWRDSKILLRQLARKYLPPGILRRPKQGFAVPMASWLRGELRPWLHDVLLSRVSQDRGIFSNTAIHDMLALHQRGRRDLSQQLWALFVLESWLQRSDVKANPWNRV